MRLAPDLRPLPQPSDPLATSAKLEIAVAALEYLMRHLRGEPVYPAGSHSPHTGKPQKLPKREVPAWCADYAESVLRRMK